MTYRKLIGFGDSSFVVSLPKEWVLANNLKKGDSVSIEQEDSIIKVKPITLKPTIDIREININFDGDIKRLKAELIYAYINNYNIINILGNNLFNHLKGINEAIDNLVALEVIQKTSQKITIKDFLNVNDISIHDTLRRMDRIVISMSEDIKEYLIGKNNKVLELLEHKEKDVNRLSNLIFKVLKRGFFHNDRAILKLDLDDIFYYWELTIFIEKVGDQLKRIPRYIKPSSNDLVLVFNEVMQQYCDAMKSNFTKDYDLALNILTKKSQVYNNVDKLLNKLPLDSIPGLEKIKNINNFAGNLVKVYLKLRLQKDKN